MDMWETKEGRREGGREREGEMGRERKERGRCIRNVLMHCSFKNYFHMDIIPSFVSFNIVSVKASKYR